MNNPSGSEFSLKDLLRILNRRRRILLSTAGAVFLFAVLACIFMTRRYKSEGVFELQKSSSDSLDLEDMMGAAAGGASDSLSLNTDLETEASILQSDSLALRVIKELNLERNKDFQPTFNPIGMVLRWITPAGPPDRPGAPLEDSPRRREALLRTFRRFLSVKVDAGTRLIEVQFSNRDPKVAADVANHLIQALIDYNFQTKYQATNMVSTWLEGQLGDLRKQSEDLQARVVALQQGSGIFGVGGTDLQGKPVVYSPILDQLQESSALLTQAEMNSIIKGSIYQVAKTGDADLISQLAGTTLMSNTGQGVTDSMALIENLRQQEATIRAQIGQDASQFGPQYPKLIEERASLRSVQALLSQEVQRIASRAKNDYEIAQGTLKGAQTTYDSDQKKAEKLNDKTIEYMILSKEAEESDDLYQDLLKRLKEAGILEGLHSSDITSVDTALPPARPDSPNVPLFLMLGAGMGMILGCAVALFADTVDNKIQSTDEIEAMGIPLLGIVPQVNSSEMAGKLIQLDSRASEFGEAIRRLRSALLISRSGHPPQVFLIASGNPGEGKSTLALNLAVALAQYNKKVLLIEADMRRPVLQRRLHLKVTRGLSEVLANQSAAVELESLPDYPNLYVLPAGAPPPYPSELVGAAPLQMLFEEWRKAYDYVVIDSPPVLPVTDVQLLIAQADATVLVVRAGKTTRVGLSRAYRLLTPHVKDPVQPAIGALLNGISTRSAAYYGYYGNHGYKRYYHRDDGDSNDQA